MSLDALAQKSFSVLSAVGGWLTIAEALTSQVVFLIAYLLTGRLLTSVIVAIAGVVVFAIVRVCTDRKYWSAVISLAMVGMSALLAGRTGQGIDFYVKDIIAPAVLAVVFLVSVLVRWPMVGLVVGTVRGERTSWRRDRVRRRRYQACTAVFLAKFGTVIAVMLPLYVAGQFVALGVASILLDTPGTALCVYVCWRILRDDAKVGRVTDGPASMVGQR